MVRRLSCVMGAVCGIAGAAAPAQAQAPQGPHLGGGSVGPHSLMVSFTPRTVGWQFRVSATADCPRGAVSLVMTGLVTPAADGTFTHTGHVRAVGLPRPSHVRGNFTLTGTMVPNAANGRIAATVSYRRHGKRTHCKIFGNNAAWSARNPSASPPAPPPFTGPLTGTLFGLSTQNDGSYSYTVLVHPWHPAGRFYILWEARPECNHGAETYSFVNATGILKPDSQGRFRYHDRFKIHFSDAVSTYRSDTTGQLLTGGAIGTLRLRETYRSHGVTVRCDTHRLTWGAAP